MSTSRQGSQSTYARGYGHRHQNLRAQYAARMAAGETFICWRCHLAVDPRKPWDLGHDDHDRSLYRGPEHVACNRGNRSKSRRRWEL